MLSFVIHPDIINPERYEIINIEYKGLNLYQCLLELGIDSDGLKPIYKINEKEVDGDYVVCEGDVIHIYFELEAPVLVAIAGAAAASAGVGAALASSALIAGIIDAMVAMVATFAAQALMRALGLMPSTSESESSSPTYGWDDFTNSVGEGAPIPILYGKHKVAGQIINQTIDIDGNKEYLNVLMALTDHQIDSITDVRVNDQPYTYYKGVTYQTRLGTLNQSVISGFGELSYQQNTDVRLKQNVSNIRQTDGDQVEKIELVFSAPNGLFRADDEGDYHSVGIDIDIYYRVLGAPSWLKYKTHRIEGKSKEAIRNTCVIDNLSPEQYELKIVRTTSDSTDFKEVDIVYFTSIREVVKEELSYPGVPLLAVKALASDQLSGSTPSFTCIIERATVSVYNPYTELWIERSAYNPAWQCYDLLVNVHNINKDYIIYDEFLAWANYCDEYIDEANTKRFVASVYIDNQASVWSNVQRLSNLGRAVILRKGLYYGVFVDKADDVVTNIFNMSNIVEDSFSIKYFNVEDRANAYEISYTDPDRDYSNQIAAVYSDEYKDSETLDNKTNSQVYAAIPRQQAFRECAFSLNQNRLQKKVIAFKALTESFNCSVGDLIYFCHEVPDTDNVISGRILSAGNDGGYGYVAIEKEFDYDGENTYNLLIRDSQDRITESVVISNFEDIWDYIGTPEPLLNTDQSFVLTDNSTTVAEGIEQRFVLATSKSYSAAVEIAKDSVGKATRFPTMLIEFSGSTTEVYYVKLDTSNGSVRKTTTINGTQTSNIDDVAEDYGDYWKIKIENVGTIDPLNTSVIYRLAPARGASSSWAISVTAMGSATFKNPVFEDSESVLISNKTLTLSTAFTNIPDSDSVYVLGKADVVRKKYRLVRCQSENNGFSTLEALEYLDALYTDDDFVIEEDELDIPVTQDATAVKINERLVYGAAGDFQSVLDINWNSTTNLNYSNWTIYLQKITNSYEFGNEFDGFESSGISNDIINVGDSVYNKYTIPANLVEINEVYRVYVCPKDKGCYDTGYNTAIIQTLGKFNNPGNVTYFNCEWDAATRTVSASWTLVSDIDVVGYEIRKGTDWETGTFVILAGNQNQISFLIPSGTSETVTYWIKAVDSSGIYSETAIDDTIDVDTTQTTIEIPTGLELSTYSTIENSGQSKTYINCFWESNAELSQYFQAYSLLVEDVESGRVIQYVTQDSEYTVEVDANKLYTVKVQAIDVYGNRSAYCQAKAIYSSTDGNAPDAPVWSQLVEGFKTIFLKWNTGSENDIAYYQIQRASNSEFTSGVVNTGNKSGTFTTINDLDVAATYYFRIRAVDGSGNSSAWSTVISGTTLQIGSADVAYNSIGANHIYVDELSAISANCGTLTSGVIQSINWSETAGVQIDLDNEVFKIGGSDNPALEWDGNEITVRNSNEGQELSLSGTSITVGDLTDGDYCVIDSGDIEFYRYIAGEHRQTKSLKRVEYGTATNGVTTTLPGYWKTQPKIIVSPLGCSFYSPLYPLQEQSLDCQATNIEETFYGSGVYRFLPKIQLVLADGSAITDIEDEEVSGSNLSFDDSYETFYSDVVTTSDNVTELTLYLDRNLVGVDHNNIPPDTGYQPYYYLKFYVYAIIDDDEANKIQILYAEQSGQYLQTSSGEFSYFIDGLDSGEHTIQIRLDIINGSGSVTLEGLGYTFSEAVTLATGTLNYIAIGE